MEDVNSDYNGLPQNTELPNNNLQYNSVTTTNPSQNDLQQGTFISYCDCGLEPVLREVKANTLNKGRLFCRATPSISLHWRYKNPSHRASFPQTPGSPPTRSQSHLSLNSIDDELSTRNLTGDVYTRKPAVFDNWNDVPKYSTPQLLDVLQNHLMQQDRNYQKWYTAYQSTKQDLEDARKEIEKSNRDYEILDRENKLYKREIKFLKSEKRSLEDENVSIKEENQELKRR
ncbi:11578_t:CDS:2 [Funneliformis geosporum]|uniref:11578_t:CDS:1 n=1 Tax=Funneliformis geosporum TaxID=1117311 RepID=A0A9W4SHA7_9GLOM|nr:11578_t:CDS:2 [Funneliformis geosporum]